MRGAAQSILPELPVKVIVKQFAVQELSIGEPVVGAAARLAIAGKATLGPPSEGLDLSLSAERLDAPGALTVLLAFVPATSLLTLNVDSAEPAGGLFAHFAKLPGLPPVKLAFDGAGPLDAFKAKLDFTAGPDIWANGQSRPRPPGWRAAPRARPEIAARGPRAGHRQADLRRRNDASRATSSSTTIRASASQACTSFRRAPGSTFRGRRDRRLATSTSKSTPARFRVRRRSENSTSTRRSRARSPARRSTPPSTRSKSMSPKDRSTMSPRPSAPPRTAL